ncbi:hydrogenase maturation nickel metallochaperone HypA [Dethiothermospora halolimnae]|uniref:hydrogenase maturation nickel metallochaperone HypA n=1 Tax=Dethiothermospora halolimnae TaxID=3114390 RepID=UPI003CCBAFB6
MHEVSVMTEVFQIINENIKIHNLKRIDKVVLKIGSFTCIEESSLRFVFKSMAKETICKDAELIIVKVKARAYCDYCKHEFNIEYTNKICPKCNRFSSNIIDGYELLLESIEGE